MLYYDGRVYKNSKEFLEKNEITLMSHPTKRSLLGEILKLYRYGFVPEERLYRFCEDLAKTGFKSSFLIILLTVVYGGTIHQR